MAESILYQAQLIRDNAKWLKEYVAADSNFESQETKRVVRNALYENMMQANKLAADIERLSAILGIGEK